MAHSTSSVAPAATPAPTSTPTPAQNHAPEIVVSPFYHSAVNAVTQPNKITHTSHYFIDRWMPLLGGNGTMIVLALRRSGFLNRKTGERRDEIVVSRDEIAEACGLSADTLTRELGIDKKTGKLRNEWLGYFVQKRRRYRRDRNGQVRQEESAYWISMDDPIHPDDWPQVEAAALEAESQRSKQPETHFAFPVGISKTQSAEFKTQSASGETQSAEFKTQSASALNTLDSSLLKNTSPDFSEGSASLFPEEAPGEEQPPKQTQEQAPPPASEHLSWESLSETERAPWLSQARQELVAIHAGSGITPRPKLIEVRGRNLYRAAQTALARSPVPPQ